MKTKVLTKKTKTQSVKNLIEKACGNINKVAKNYAELKANGENTYQNKDGVNKEKARIVMANHVIASGVTGVIPTLPNEDWIVEQKVAKKLKNVSFLGVECEEPTYKIMKTNLRKTKLKATTHFGKINEVIFGKMENTYAHLILDYCGMLPTFAKELEYAINNNIVKVGGIIAMTFAKPIRGTGGMFEYISGLGKIKTNLEDGRCMSDRATEAYINKITGFNYEFVELFDYMDKYPMTLVIIKRIK